MALSIGGAVMWSLWPPPLKSLAEEIKARANAVQVGLVAVGAAGAAFTLWLAVRRQSTTEEDSRQQRMTELYTAAVEQLGHDSAAVRLGALYALQRLGQTYPEQRRAIVNVWCAYLRMPFRDPDADGLEEEEREKRRQELEVRLTVQRLLREHAHSGPHNGKPASPRFWGDELDVDLTGATLHQLDLSGCRIHPNTTFTEATFTGETSFLEATFTGETSFLEATFTGETSFLEATFTDRVLFNKATFTSHVLFYKTTFTSHAWFYKTTFTSQTSFNSASFTNGASFTEASFTGDAAFHSASFTGDAQFEGVVASCAGEHVWPVGWELVPADDVDVPEGGDPDATWGRLVQLNGAASGEAPGEPDEDVEGPRRPDVP
ncbi:pentapeptide repeat-containing protein [Saccharomonospora glauca]|uniref:pentapeptide repeat-containing protein n=1 Tax=Saccharomonospora glauca TaxID=40990 RepID=UPI0012F7E4E4|nr:pentapeptide repeat-containing protein [Saccharomonospora glauca]